MCMATMASTSHGLSVLANSCIKNPIDPRTGLTASIKERRSINFYDVNDNINKLFPFEGTNNQNNFRTSVDMLQSAKEEEFFDKLQQLKSENKKTLEAYERLYKERMLLEGKGTYQTDTFQYDKSGIDREINTNIEGLVVDQNFPDGNPKQESLFKKPPSGKPIDSKETPSPTVSRLKISHQSRKKERPSSAPIARSQSLDDEKWHAFLNENGLIDSCDGNYVIASKETLSNDQVNAQARIERMWENFTIPEPTERRRSFSGSDKKAATCKKEQEKHKTKEWRHRITVPEPFRMSIREALKERKKTSAQQELEQRRLEKQKEEEAECEKKFKAQPAPSHIYIPLYEEILEKNNSRRKYVKQYCQELLKSQVKPFNFEVREKVKHQQKTLTTATKKLEKPPKQIFKAKPAPKNIFDVKIDEKLNEEEELRKIRIKMRSKELLREASLPPNMAEREKLKEQERKEKARKAKLITKKSKPKSAHTVPDYDALYSEFCKELAHRKSIKESTRVKPFEMETDRIRSSREWIMRDIENDEKNLKENRWPYTNSRETPRSSLKYLGALSTSMDSIPTISTKAADLRNIKIKKEKDRAHNRQIQDEEAEARRRAREAKLRKYLNERAGGDEVSKPKESIAARLKRIKQEDRERQDAYQRELNEMKNRVDSSPLLVEKFMKENAKKEAERKFNNTVKDAGLNGFSLYESQRASSIRTGDGDGYESGSNENLYAGDPDLTYTKGGSQEELSDSEEN